MKLSLIYLIMLLSLFISSCSTEENVEEVMLFDPPLKPQLVNWSVMNTAGWKNMSFPTWFSPELIDSSNIESVLVGFTNFNFTDSIVNITDTIPHKTVEINFGNNGSVKKLAMTEFSNGIQLAQHIFSYNSKTDALGYSPPVVSSNVKYREKSMMSFLNTLQELQQYHRFVLQEVDSTVITYIDKSSIDEVHHYFILDSANWNVFYIDHHFKPEGKSIFYYGSPTHYTSSFSLVNLVEKSMKQTHFYYPSNALKSQYFYTNDFITKRSFTYDSKGILMGVNDSLVTTSNEFLHSEKGIIKYNQNFPKEINFFSAEDTLMNTPIKRISIDYTYKE